MRMRAVLIAAVILAGLSAPILARPHPPVTLFMTATMVRLQGSGTAGGWTPRKLVVYRGQRVTLRIHCYEGTHVFTLPAFHVTTHPLSEGDTATVTFVPDRAGTFPYACGLTCGPLHPEMRGKLVVLP